MALWLKLSRSDSLPQEFGITLRERLFLHVASTVMCLLGSLVVIIMWKSLVRFARYFQLPAFWACGRIAFSRPLVIGRVPVPSDCQRVLSGSVTCIPVQPHLIVAARPSKVLSASPSEARNIWLLYRPGSQNKEFLSGAPSQLAVDT